MVLVWNPSKYGFLLHVITTKNEWNVGSFICSFIRLFVSFSFHVPFCHPLIWLIDWMIDWLVGWLLIDLLIDWLIDWLIGWLIGWLIDSLFGWLVGWLIDWLVDWLIDWLLGWLVDWLIDWLIDWLVGWLVWTKQKQWTGWTYRLTHANWNCSQNQPWDLQTGHILGLWQATPGPTWSLNCYSNRKVDGTVPTYWLIRTLD